MTFEPLRGIASRLEREGPGPVTGETLHLTRKDGARRVATFAEHAECWVCETFENLDEEDSEAVRVIMTNLIQCGQGGDVPVMKHWPQQTSPWLLTYATDKIGQTSGTA